MKKIQNFSLRLLAFAALTCMLMLTSRQSAAAQDSTDLRNLSVEERAEKQTELQAEKLQLNEEQREAMHDINLKYARKVEELRQGGRSFRTMRKIKALRKDKEKEIKEVLTDEQYKEYQALQEEMRNQFRNNRNN